MPDPKIIWCRFKAARLQPFIKYSSSTHEEVELCYPKTHRVIQRDNRAINLSIGSYFYRRFQLIGLTLLLTLLTLPGSAFAQSGGGDAVAKFKEAADKITKAIQQISGIAILLLLVGGFGLLMWGGISESFRVKAVRIITFSIIGAACLFLFAQPLADFLTSTFGANGSA